ncbi:hypothetical protein MATL_G00041670 [Megalops atlanticus]|uniref:Ion transport domain-containing protein n=1 Tax=Megalops atlanticus TaxID=7932 RepID=A0A9D3TEA5_MEGAT|nr:hypothetical protein MATL_G00041670 [Megalops atlanticus]
MSNPYQSVCITEADSQGNMVLHALVMVADNTPENTDFVTKMYDEILIMSARLHPKTKLEYIENKEGLTPIKLAAKTGKIGLFKHMMQREFKDKDIKHLSRKFTEWVYGPVHCSLYDLASLDSYETNSVLEIIVYGSEIPNRHEMLQTEPLNRLLEDKWQRFARWIFFFNFIVYVMYVAVFTFTAYYRKEGKPPFPIEHSTEGYLRLSGQLTCVVASVYFFCKAIVDFKRKPPKLQTLLIDGYCEILFFLQAVFYIFSSILYTFGKEEYVGLLVLCLALSWINLLYFSRGSRLMGIYSVMIQKMLLSDIVRFLFVYIVFLFGFSAAVVTLIQEKTNATNVKPVQSPDNPKSRALFATVDDSEGCKKPTYNNFSYTTLELFKFTIGMGDLEFTEDYQFKGVFYVLLITYIVLTYILLLNMLIALMSKTVEKISRESKNIWKLQKAITILDLEKSLPNCLRERLRSGVQKDLSKTAGEDRRWCFRVEEVNWNKWNTDLGIINEDPGNCDGTRTPGPVRGPGWRHTLRAFSRRQPRRQAAHEMDPFPL